MSIAGIIAEYNPFHNGHAYHIAKTRERADHVICILSGHFTQRGEPAIADKWLRTRLALTGGADVVIELPFLFAVQSAEGFAAGAVRILDALNSIDFLSFGTECVNQELLLQCAHILAEEPPAFQCALKDSLNIGLPFPRARERALSFVIQKDLSDLLAGSNTILALEYLKALLRLHSPLVPLAIKRAGGAHMDDTLYTDCSSARSIRSQLHAKGLCPEVLNNVPACCAPLYHFMSPVSSEAYFKLLMFRLRSMQLAELSAIADMTEGLEYRIDRFAQSAQTLEQLIGQVKTKRYTHTRISRVLLYCLFGITKETVCQANTGVFPLYARILGYRKKKEALVSRLCQNASIPVLMKASNFTENQMLHYDHAASDVYAVLHKKIAPGRRDFTEKLIVI